jgi:hypothetical protein
MRNAALTMSAVTHGILVLESSNPIIGIPLPPNIDNRFDRFVECLYDGTTDSDCADVLRHWHEGNEPPYMDEALAEQSRAYE